MSTIVAHLVLEGLNTTDTHAKHDADTVLVLLLQIHAAILDSLLGSNEGQLRVAVHLASLLAVQIVVHVEVFHLAGELSLEVGCIEMCNRGSTALASEEVLPCFLHVVTQWRNGTQSCYYYSF